jgi:ABC-2 type transport system permease protein
MNWGRQTMKSNRCLFNRAIFKSDFKRFLPFAIPLLIANIIIFPFVIFSNFNIKVYPLNLDDFADISMAADIACFIFSGVFAVLVFSYLYKPSTCISLHSFPVGRKGLFVTSFLAGYVLLVLPQLAGFAVSLPSIFATSKAPGTIILLQIVSIFADSFIFFSSGVLAVMLAGNIFAGSVLYLVINLACYAIWELFNTFVMEIGVGINTPDDDSVFFFYSPLTELFVSKESYGTRFVGENDLSQFSAYFTKAAIYFAISLVVIALAYLLYKARRLECAGDMVAFKIEIPVISVLVSLVGSAVATLLIREIASFGRELMLWFFAVFCLIIFFLTQMILRKKANVFSLKIIILAVVTCLIAVAAIWGTATYRTNLIPNAESVKKVVVNTSYDIELTDKADIDSVRDFHVKLLENTKNDAFLLNSSWNNYNRVIDSSYTVYSISLNYELENGKTVERYYSFRETDKELVSIVEAFEEKYHPKSVFDTLDRIKYEVYGASIHIFDNENGTDETLYVPKERFDELLNAVRTVSGKELENYRTVVNEIDINSFSFANQSVTVSFECRLKEKVSDEAVAELSLLTDDVSGVSCGNLFRYDRNEGKDVVNDTFEIIYCSSDNVEQDFADLLKSFR